MKKRDTIIVIILGIITVAVIVMGFRYRQNIQAELVNNSNYKEINQTESFEARQKKKEEEKRAKFLAAFDDKREKNTVADFLQYVKYAKGDTTVAFYGEIEDQAQWAVDNMTQLASDRAFTEMQTRFVSTVGSETIGERVEELTEMQPDVVFFHTPMPVQGAVSWAEDGESIEINNISEILLAYGEMKDALPESLIVLVTPAPRAVDPEAEEELSWHQVEIDELVRQSGEYAIPVFNLHDQVMAHVSANVLTIAGLYNEDGTLTAETAELMKNMFAENLKTLEIDTTTAYVLDGKPAEVDIVIEVYEEESVSEESVGESSVAESDESVELESEWYESETEVDEWVEKESEESESTYVPPVQRPTTPASKPAESKPASKPAESKPAESKPVESKPVESKPAESKPVESKPVESKPAEPKPEPVPESSESVLPPAPVESSEVQESE